MKCDFYFLSILPQSSENVYVPVLTPTWLTSLCIVSPALPAVRLIFARVLKKHNWRAKFKTLTLPAPTWDHQKCQSSSCLHLKGLLGRRTLGHRVSLCLANSLNNHAAQSFYHRKWTQSTSCTASWWHCVPAHLGGFLPSIAVIIIRINCQGAAWIRVLFCLLFSQRKTSKIDIIVMIIIICVLNSNTLPLMYYPPKIPDNYNTDQRHWPCSDCQPNSVTTQDPKHQSRRKE